MEDNELIYGKKNQSFWKINGGGDGGGGGGILDDFFYTEEITWIAEGQKRCLTIEAPGYEQRLI